MKINKKIVSKLIDHYGAEEQTTVCMEELAELIQAISKEKRGIHNVEHLAEEMADVLICIENLKQIYGVSENLINDWIIYKQCRAETRLTKEQ